MNFTYPETIDKSGIKADLSRGIIPGGLSSMTPEPVRGSLRRNSELCVRQLLRKFGRLSPDDPLQTYVEEVARRVIPIPSDDQRSSVSPRVIILDDSTTRFACALPDGSILIAKGMLSLLRSEDEVAALIAHEWVHVARSHAKRVIEKDQAIRNRIARGEFSSLSLLETFGAERADELEADILASCEFLARSGYNPRGVSELTQRLIDDGEGLSFSSSHGVMIDRRDIGVYLLAKLNQRGSNKPFKPIPENIRSRVASVPASQDPGRDEKTVLYESLLEELKCFDRIFETGHRLTTDDWLSLSLCLQESSSLIIESRKRSGRVANSGEPSEIELLLPKVTQGVYTRLFKGRANVDEGTKLFSFAIFLQDACCMPLFANNEIRILGILTGDGTLLESELKEIVLNLRYEDKLSLQSMSDAYEKENLFKLPLFSSALVDNLQSPNPFINWLEKKASLFESLDDDSMSEEMLFENMGLLFRSYEAALLELGMPPDRAYILSVDNAQRLLNERIHGTFNIEDETVSKFPFLSFLKDQTRDKLKEILLVLQPEEAKRSQAFRSYLTERGEQAIGDLRRICETTPEGESETILSQFFGLLNDDVENDTYSEQLWKQGIMLGVEYIKDNELFWEIITNYLNNRIYDPDRTLANVLDTEMAWENEGEFLSDIVKMRHEGSFQRAFLSSPAAVEGFSIFFSGLLNFADKITGADEALEFMTRMTERVDFDFPSLYSAFARSEQTRETTKKRVEELVERSQTFIARVASHPCTDAGLLTLSSLFINPENRLQFQQHLLLNLASQLSFDELVDLAFKSRATKTPAIWGVLERRIEESSQKGFQLDKLLEHGTRMVLEREFELAGGLNVIDAVMEKGVEDPERLLKAALDTVRSERPLLAYGLQKWWERFGQIVLEDLEIPRLLISENAMEDWLTDSLAEAANGEQGEAVNPYLEDLNVRALLNVLYDSGPFTRAFLVRKALMNSEYGILRSTSSAKRVMKPFLEEHIDLEPTTKQEVAKVLEAIIDSSTSSELCFIGLPGLASRVFIRPPSESDVEEALEESGLLDEISSHLADVHNVNSLKDADREWARECELFLPERFANLHELVLERLRNLVFGNIREKKDIFKALPLRAETAIVQSLPAQQEELRRQKKISAPEILKEIGRREGAPGPRFLQLYFQSFPMPPEKKAELVDVHDDIPGQTKPVAYMTIREMAPGLIRPGDTLGPLRGGGSLVTVYSLTRAGDEDLPLVVKVLNPNAEARVEDTMGRARRWVNKLIENEPENQVYKHIHQYILDELEAWLLSDIRDERFVELDKRFRNKWHDYKIGKNYSIGVPLSYDVRDFIDLASLHGSENPNIYVKVEEEIEGKNLTQFSPGAHTDFQRGLLSLPDAKEIMTLIVSNYIEQVLEGLVHSNPQLGNFRLRSDGKVFVIDRNYFLEFNDREKKLFKTLIRGAAFGGDTKRTLLDHFFADPENSRINEENKRGVYAILQKYENDISLNGLSRLLAELKQNGLKVPLRFSLLAINFNALDSMCRDLGLSGLSDAISSKKILPKITPGIF